GRGGGGAGGEGGPPRCAGRAAAPGPGGAGGGVGAPAAASGTAAGWRSPAVSRASRSSRPRQESGRGQVAEVESPDPRGSSTSTANPARWSPTARLSYSERLSPGAAIITSARAAGRGASSAALRLAPSAAPTGTCC